MRAVVCQHLGSYKDLVVSDWPAPEVAAGQVRIKVAYASVSFAITLMVAGRYQRKATPPFVPGTEVSGVVDAVGAGVTEFASGERVAAIVRDGGYAEYVTAPAHMIYKVPPSLGLDQAVNVPISYGTAYAGLNWRAGLQSGEWLLVHGAAGALGLAAVQVGAMAGATVIATASTKAKCDAALAAGAVHAANYAEDGFAAAVKRLTGGQGTNVVFDPVGGDVLEESLHAAAIEGRLITAGFASGNIPRVPANILLVKNLSLLGLNFSEYFGWGEADRGAEYAPRVKSAVDTLFKAVVAGDLRPTIGHSLPLEKVVEALDHLVERRAIGKVVLAVSPEP